MQEPIKISFCRAWAARRSSVINVLAVEFEREKLITVIATPHRVEQAQASRLNRATDFFLGGGEGGGNGPLTDVQGTN